MSELPVHTKLVLEFLFDRCNLSRFTNVLSLES